ncbi:MAG: glycosyltransferase [Burkholderiales bacterium]|jgi:glycosyltransferase involved in cell wall biosynthesis|nr:glycosyltransferase [Burkholderiales bacterium]
MQKQPQLSLLLVAHDQAAYLPATLASLAAQTIGLDPLELVLIDDASTDATGELIDAFAKEHPCVKVKYVSFRNVGKTRNAALALATAPYLMFVDGDDALAPNACEILLQQIQNSAEEKRPVDMIVTALQRFQGTPMLRPAKTAPFTPVNAAELWEALLRHRRYMGHLIGCLFSRRLFETLCFPEMECYEDIFIVPDIFAQSPHILISETQVYYYRQHDRSTSTKLNNVKAGNMLAMLAKLKKGVKDDQQQRLFEALCVKQCRVLLDNAKDISDDNRKAIAALMEAIPLGAFLLSPRLSVNHKRLLLKNRKELRRK